jgi:hypothetical protein
VDALASQMTTTLPWPDGIGGYEVLDVLSAGGGGDSALAVAPGNRRVVLKRLDPDCLLRAAPNPRLHPGIRDRLARVRELAHARVANLYGVEHDAGLVYLVWEFVDGVTLEEWAANAAVPRLTPQQVLLVARELILTVESLHARGIVHGAIHGRNVIVDNEGRVKLVHVSPLLYTEPKHDLASIAGLFRELAARVHEEDAEPLRALACEAEGGDGTLRSLGSRAASLIDARPDGEGDQLERRADRRRRRASRVTAAAVVLIALVLSYGVKQYVRSLTPRPPAPPEAPVAAME